MSGSPRSSTTASGGERASASSPGPVGGGLDLVALEAQGALERGVHCGIVVDHQDFHRAPPLRLGLRVAHTSGARITDGHALFWLVRSLPVVLKESDKGVRRPTCRSIVTAGDLVGCANGSDPFGG